MKIKVLAIVLLLGLCGYIMAAYDNLLPEHLAAKSLFHDGNYKECIHVLENITIKYPKYHKIADVRSLMGSSYLKLKNYSKGKSIIEQLQKDFPDAEENLKGLWEYQLAFIDNAQGDQGQALSRFKSYIFNYPMHNYVLNAIAKIDVINNNDIDGATLSAAIKLIENYPENPGIGKAKVIVLRNLYRKQEYKESIELGKDIINNHTEVNEIDLVTYILGSSYDRLGDFDEAISYFENLLSTSSDRKLRSIVACRLGRIFYKRGNYPEAIEHLEACISKHDYSTSLGGFYYYLGLTYNNIGDKVKADRIFKEILKRFPGSIWAEKSELILSKGADFLGISSMEFDTSASIALNVECGIKLGWSAIPAYDQKSAKIKSVEVIFFVEEAYANWKLKGLSSGTYDYEIKWIEGPGPFNINVDIESDIPSISELKGKAIIEIKNPEPGIDIEGKTATSTFVFSDYVKSLQAQDQDQK